MAQVIAKALPVLVEAYANVDEDIGLQAAPSWARVVFTQDLIDRVQAMASMCVDGITQVRSVCVFHWGPEGVEEEVSLQSPTMVVTSGLVWFEEEMSHHPFVFKTRVISIEDLNRHWSMAEKVAGPASQASIHFGRVFSDDDLVSIEAVLKELGYTINVGGDDRCDVLCPPDGKPLGQFADRADALLAAWCEVRQQAASVMGIEPILLESMDIDEQITRVDEALGRDADESAEPATAPVAGGS